MPRAVDVGELALHLQVPIPLQSSWLGEVSPACASLLSGLFELRPSLRLGGRNISALKGHAWLREKAVDDWQALESKTLAPFFRPGKVPPVSCIPLYSISYIPFSLTHTL